MHYSWFLQLLTSVQVHEHFRDSNYTHSIILLKLNLIHMNTEHVFDLTQNAFNLLI